MTGRSLPVCSTRRHTGHLHHGKSCWIGCVCFEALTAIIHITSEFLECILHMCFQLPLAGPIHTCELHRCAKTALRGRGGGCALVGVVHGPLKASLAEGVATGGGDGAAEKLAAQRAVQVVHTPRHLPPSAARLGLHRLCTLLHCPRSPSITAVTQSLVSMRYAEELCELLSIPT